MYMIVFISNNYVYVASTFTCSRHCLIGCVHVFTYSCSCPTVSISLECPWRPNVHDCIWLVPAMWEYVHVQCLQHAHVYHSLLHVHVHVHVYDVNINFMLMYTCTYIMYIHVQCTCTIGLYKCCVHVHMYIVCIPGLLCAQVWLGGWWVSSLVVCSWHLTGM